METVKLYLGDCLEYLKTMEDKSVDMILQDPPYNQTACAFEWDIMTKIEEFWVEWKRVIKDNGAIVMTASQPFTSKLVMSNLKMFKYEWIWDKIQPTGAFTVKKQPMKLHENIIVFYNKQPIYNRQFTERPVKNLRPNQIETTKKLNKVEYEYLGGQKKQHSKDWNYTKVNPKTIIQFQKSNQRNKKFKHSTQKPVALMEYLIKTYTNEDDTVFDGFIGSGTTGVACVNLNRNFIGCELDEKYFEIAKQRIKEAEKVDISRIFK